jgi:hypothetical protein
VRSLSKRRLVVVGWVLQHNHAELFVRRNHDLVLVRPDPYKRDVFFRVESFDRRLCLRVELSDEGAILNSFVLAHGGPDSDSFLVDNHDPDDTHVCPDSINRLFHLL